MVSAVMTRAFGYLRVSGKAQVDGDGFPRQRAAIEAYAAQNGIEIAQWFEEKGVCGATEWDDRPAFMEMLEALLSNGVRTVLVEKVDRLARDLMVQESIIADFGRKELTLISTCEPDLCSNEPTRILMRQMMGAFAQYEKSTIVAKLRAARNRKKRETGRCEGAKPYGYTAVEADTLEMMKSLRREGRRYDAIAEYLNKYAYVTRHGKSWYGTTVANILKRQEETN